MISRQHFPCPAGYSYTHGWLVLLKRKKKKSSQHDRVFFFSPNVLDILKYDLKANYNVGIDYMVLL